MSVPASPPRLKATTLLSRDSPALTRAVPADSLPDMVEMSMSARFARPPPRPAFVAAEVSMSYSAIMRTLTPPEECQDRRRFALVRFPSGSTQHDR